MRNHNLEDWLVEFDIPAAAAQPDSPSGPPTGNPDFADSMSSEMPNDPNAPNADYNLGKNPEEEVQDQENEIDPEYPDIPEDKKEEDFEIWKSNYFKETIKNNPNDLLDMLSPMRDREDLSPYQRKFVDDNYNVQLIRLNSNILEASKSIRKNIRDQLDKNSPATSIVNHISNVLDTMPHLNSSYIKMMGYYGHKGELHRKFIAALTNSVQVSSSPDKENVILNEREYSVKICTRLNSDWGDISLGSWALKEDDPERYLSEPELDRLAEGSPEEKEILRKRIIIESISKQFEELSFIINVVNDDGTIYYLGWDIANSLRMAYADGKLVIKTEVSDNSEAIISDDGTIIPMIDMSINYIKNPENQTDLEENVEEIQFITKRNGMLFFTAGFDVLKESASSLQGFLLKDIPYQGNPSDLKNIKKCVYSAHDMIMRQC